MSDTQAVGDGVGLDRDHASERQLRYRTLDELMLALAPHVKGLATGDGAERMRFHYRREESGEMVATNLADLLDSGVLPAEEHPSRLVWEQAVRSRRQDHEDRRRIEAAERAGLSGPRKTVRVAGAISKAPIVDPRTGQVVGILTRVVFDGKAQRGREALRAARPRPRASSPLGGSSSEVRGAGDEARGSPDSSAGSAAQEESGGSPSGPASRSDGAASRRDPA